MSVAARFVYLLRVLPRRKLRWRGRNQETGVAGAKASDRLVDGDLEMRSRDSLTTSLSGGFVAVRNGRGVACDALQEFGQFPSAFSGIWRARSRVPHCGAGVARALKDRRPQVLIKAPIVVSDLEGCSPLQPRKPI